MATTASTEASEIRRRGRRRLIGAIVIVVLAVVFVPMLLDSEPRPKRAEPSLEIPPKDKAPPLPAPAAAPKKAAETMSAPVTAADTVAPAPDKGTSGPPSAAPQETKADSASPRLEGFAVQVGAFKDEAKLAAARDKLTAARIPHFVERRGDLNRLRAGPYPSREAADEALASIKAAALDGQVVPLP